MSFTKCHEDLEIWKKSIKLVKETYVITKSFPKDERFVLIPQMRRAAISIPSNIAEGAARKSKNEFAHFLSISLGSLSELETQFIISAELEYLNDIAEVREQIVRIRLMTSALYNKLQANL
jgi:four helix bundle protein